MNLYHLLNKLIKSKTFIKSFLVFIVVLNLGAIGFVYAANAQTNLQPTDYYTTTFGTASDYNLLSIHSCNAHGDKAASGFLFGILSAISLPVAENDFQTPACKIADRPEAQQTDPNNTNPANTTTPSAVPQPKTSLNLINKDDSAVVAYFQQHNGGLLNVVNNINNTLINQRPSSGVDYIQDKIYALSHSGAVYASCDVGSPTCIQDLSNPARYYQGTGSDLLKPIQGFWGWSVKIVEAVMILIVIVIAFAIIFRQKLPGNVEVTLQNSIPNIALAMILIPFSYAITGLVIDAITLGTNTVHDALIGPSSPGHAVYDNRSDLYVNPVSNQNAKDRGLYPDDTRVNWFNIRDNIDITQQVKQFGATLNTDPNSPIPGGGTGVDNFAVFSFISTILNFFTGKNDRTGTNSYWIGSILNFIISLLMIYNGIRIFIKLFSKYLVILITPIFSPFVFATIAIPGNGSKSIVQYLKSLFAASAAYIVTYLMFLLTLVFTNSSFQNSIPNARTGTFIPPLLGIGDILGNQSSPSFVHLLLSLVGVGIYFSIPKILKQVDESLGVNDKQLQQLLSTPFDSIKESANVTFKGAPAAAARASQITAGGVRNIASGANNSGFAVLRARDKIMGISDSDPRSVASKRKQANVTKRQQLLSQLDSAEGRPVERANILGQLAMLDAKEGLQGKEFSTKTEEGKDRSIKATFKWGGAEGQATMTQAQIDTYVAQAGPGGSWTSQDIGELIIEAQNFTFPAVIDRESILIGTVKPANQIAGGDFALLGTKEIFEYSLPIDPASPGRPTTPRLKLDVQAQPVVGGAARGEDIFSPFIGGSTPAVSPNQYMRLFITTNDYNTDNGKILKMKMKLFISNVQVFFKGSPGVLPIFAPGAEILSEKRSIKIGAYSTDPVRVIFKRVQI